MTAAHQGPIESKITIKQHPLHPMMVSFPIAFLSSTILTDAAFWWLGDPFWAAVSFWLCAAGFAIGVLAALVGLADFVQIEEARRHVTGWSHLIVAIAALALALLVAVTGWLGGSLTFRHGIGTYWHELDRAQPDEADEPLQQ